MKTLNLTLGMLAVLMMTSAAVATTFVVPSDREMVQRANAIVIATALPSYSRPTPQGGVETVTPFIVEEKIKGALIPDRIDVVEPGGSYGGVTTLIAGVPRFEPSERCLLLLAYVDAERWAVTDLVLGKFSFADDRGGQHLLVRDEDEIIGWDPNLKPHLEPRRAAEPFLDFIRTEARGGIGNDDYFVTRAPLVTATTMFTPSTAATGFSITSYTMTVSGSMGARWNVFPSAVAFYVGTTTEPGAPGGGTTAITTALASWDNDCPSNVNYTFAGTDDGTHTQGLHAPDGRNTILFERDLSSYGISPFSCSPTGYSGTLGIGGITSGSGTNTLGGETFLTTIEADVEMNRGLANCTLLLSSGDFNSAVTHEVGHTLGIRHSDQNRGSTGACSSDPSLECSSNAIMTAFVTHGLNAALQTWDQHAVQSLYPGGSCSTCTAPSIVQQPASATISAGQQVTLSVTAGGTAPFSYQWFTGTSGTGTPISGQTQSTLTVAPATSTAYWVQVRNSCGTANSATATITVASSAPRRAPFDFNGDGKSDLLWRNDTAQALAMWEMNGRTPINSAPFASATNPSWRIVGVGDFNGDGKSDILWWNSSSTQVAMWEMNDRTILNDQPMVVAGANWQVEAIGNFYGNAFSEIIWRNQATGSVAMWDVNGHQLLNTATIGGIPDLNWHIEAAGDFNGDGKCDLMWRNVVTSDVLLWEMNGRNIIFNGVIGNAGSAAWHIEGSGDFGGDGFADLLWRNATSGTVAMWEMRGPTILNSGSVIALSDLNWQAVAFGDYDGDGRTDIVWRYGPTGQLAMWNMQGHTIVNGATFGPVSGPSWVIQPPRAAGGPVMSATGIFDPAGEATTAAQEGVATLEKRARRRR